MKIIIINQPLGNRGDEAAHRSLLRALSQKLPRDEIYVLFQGAVQDSIEQTRIHSPNITYINFPRLRGIGQLRKYALILNMLKLSILFPCTFKFANVIKNGDLIVCAPGGICMGLYQDWEHIYWLSIAKFFNKKIVYYSRSFGPFPESNSSERHFKRISINLLRNFDFISIRDSKTMKMADKLQLKYIPSIDTAFLDTPGASIPDNIKKYLIKPYIVFVPNSLAWHPAYSNIDQNFIDDYYIKIITIIIGKYKNYTIIMLPQLFNDRKFNDKVYFNKIKDKAEKDNIVVLDDSINSDIQQSIIASSEFVIGSRYHSIIFAINNNRPFIALSYEHKISGLLSILSLNDSLVNFDTVVLSRMSVEEFGGIIEEKLISLHPNEQAKKKALEIANHCMDQFMIKYQLAQ
jgi:colanic acid/amylovoran biosynthesis protein